MVTDVTSTGSISAPTGDEANTKEAPKGSSIAESTLAGAASAPASGDPLEQMVAEGSEKMKEPQLSKDSKAPAQTDDANKAPKTKSPYLKSHFEIPSKE